MCCWCARQSIPAITEGSRIAELMTLLCHCHILETLLRPLQKAFAVQAGCQRHPRTTAGMLSAQQLLTGLSPVTQTQLPTCDSALATNREPFVVQINERPRSSQCLSWNPKVARSFPSGSSSKAERRLEKVACRPTRPRSGGRGE